MLWVGSTSPLVPMMFCMQKCAVDRRRKMLLLMCPFVQRSQGVPSAPSWANDNNSGFESPATGNDGLKVLHQCSQHMDTKQVDVDDIDLYIPVMSMITYVLIYCVQRGISAEFKPEVLSSTASFAFSILVLEDRAGIYMRPTHRRTNTS
eukprot:291699-Amphidinium_carterae.1